MAELVLSLVDAVRGQPIDDVDIDVQKMIDGTWQPIEQLTSDNKGFATILRAENNDNAEGYYEATAAIGTYFLKNSYVLPKMKFIDMLPIRFGIADINQISRIIVSITPFGYSLTMA